MGISNQDIEGDTEQVMLAADELPTAHAAVQSAAEAVQRGCLMETCAHCGKSSSSSSPGGLQRCSKCKSVKYCSRECQRAAWKGHKRECKETFGHTTEASEIAHDKAIRPNADVENAILRPWCDAKSNPGILAGSYTLQNFYANLDRLRAGEWWLFGGAEGSPGWSLENGDGAPMRKLTKQEVLWFSTMCYYMCGAAEGLSAEGYRATFEEPEAGMSRGRFLQIYANFSVSPPAK